MKEVLSSNTVSMVSFPPNAHCTNGLSGSTFGPTNVLPVPLPNKKKLGFEPSTLPSPHPPLLHPFPPFSLPPSPTPSYLSSIPLLPFHFLSSVFFSLPCTFSSSSSCYCVLPTLSPSSFPYFFSFYFFQPFFATISSIIYSSLFLHSPLLLFLLS